MRIEQGDLAEKGPNAPFNLLATILGGVTAAMFSRIVAPTAHPTQQPEHLVDAGDHVMRLTFLCIYPYGIFSVNGIYSAPASNP